MLNRIVLALATPALLIAAAQAQAQASGQKSLAATMNVYVFPNAGQAPTQQSKDEGECYQWAVSNTGSDPFDVQKQQTAQAQQAEADKAQAADAGAGSTRKGALRGAAVGALIGGIADDEWGKGAAIGAAAGGVGGNVRGRRKASAATEQVEAQAQQQQQASAAQIENFKKAFSVCLEAKKYMVKY
ncbi:MAG: YMGG-like glycine zipper-containing protein [Gammaproteobacteria bacterium]|jgi:hypothetical protein|nr:YMGG-like glycine zipper-containing protein [Gammaproteobacteria bacterium]